jgi:hypothetical protein
MILGAFTYSDRFIPGDMSSAEPARVWVDTGKTHPIILLLSVFWH